MKLLTFESLTLTGFDEFGELEGAGKTLGGGGHIPWDDPAAFARDVHRIYSVRKMYETANGEGRPHLPIHPIIRHPSPEGEYINVGRFSSLSGFSISHANAAISHHI